MSRYSFLLAALVFLAGVCLSEEPLAFKRETDDGEEMRSCVTITQSACRVFASATDRMIDRMRLREAAERTFAGVNGTNSVDRTIRGLRVERVIYLGSNQVEAVFTCDRTSRR